MSHAGDPNVETPWMDNLAAYYAMGEKFVWNIERLNQCLQSQPSIANTLQIYVSDHSDYIDSYGFFNIREYSHEKSVRIPVIFHWPDQLPAQGLVERLFSLIDLMATTLGHVDYDVPVWSQGRDPLDRVLRRHRAGRTAGRSGAPTRHGHTQRRPYDSVGRTRLWRRNHGGYAIAVSVLKFQY